MPTLLIQPLPGYAPTIGRLVAMMNYSRENLLHAARGLSRDQLDHVHDPDSNSIGALLAHIIAVERWYQALTFDDRKMSPEEEAPWAAALDLGEAGRRELRGRDLQEYLDSLATGRRMTLAALAERDDEWLERPLPAAPNMNAHWAWFHVAEDETSHRGQIRWLRQRLPK